MNLFTRHTLACFECYLHDTTKWNTEPATNSIMKDTVWVMDRRGACLGKDHNKPEETYSILGKSIAASVFSTEELLSRTERWAKETTVSGLYDTPTVDAANACVDICNSNFEIGKSESVEMNFPAHAYGGHHESGEKTGKPGRLAEKKKQQRDKGPKRRSRDELRRVHTRRFLLLRRGDRSWPRLASLMKSTLDIVRKSWLTLALKVALFSFRLPHFSLALMEHLPMKRRITIRQDTLAFPLRGQILIVILRNWKHFIILIGVILFLRNSRLKMLY